MYLWLSFHARRVALCACVLTLAGRASAQLPRLFEELPALDHPLVTRTIEAADLDQDQAPELARVDGASNTLEILANDGTGRFAPACSLAVAADPRDVIAIDWDGDGDRDLAVAARTGSKVTLLLNQFPQMSGACPAFVRQDVAVEPAPVVVRAGDLNGDGALDLVVACDQGVHAYWSGAGLGAQLTVAGAFKNPRDLELGDFDADGRIDVIVASGGMAAPQRLDLIWNDTLVGSTSWAGTVTNWINALSASATAQSIAVADFDGDGRDDFAVSYSTNPTAVALNAGNRFPSFVQASVGSPGSRLVAADLDLDGTSDLVTIVGASVEVLYDRHGGDVSQSTAQDLETRTLEAGLVTADLRPSDLDLDGDVDLAVSARTYSGAWTGRDPLLFNQTHASARQALQGQLLRGANATGSASDLQVWGDQTFVRVTAADPVLARTAYRASFAAGTNPGNWLRASVRSSVQGSAGALTASVRIYAWNWATQKLRLLGAGTTSNATNTTQFQVPLGSLRSPTGAVEIVVQHVSQSPGSTMDTDFDAITVEILP